MARSGFAGIITAIAKDAARRQRLAAQADARAVKEQARAEREIARHARDDARAQKESAREAKQRAIDDQIAKATEDNNALALRLEELANLLDHTLSVNDCIAFESLRMPTEYPAFAPPDDLIRPIVAPDKSDYQPRVSEPKGLARLIPGAQRRYAEEQFEAERRFQAAMSNHEATESKRRARFVELQDEYNCSKQTSCEKAKQRNAEVDELASAYEKGDPTAIATYSSMVLERSDYPDEFPQQFRLAYVPESKQLVVEYELPEPGIVPLVQEYRWIKSTGVIEEKPRKLAEIKILYQDIVAAVALRTIHEVFEADQGGHVEVVAFNGFVQTVDPATGKDVKPCLISLNVTKTRFMDIDLGRIEKRICLKNLGAQLSPSPNEMVAVKPVIDFDMVDKRFVDQANILGDLESRPNLMELKPFEFETLVANLFQQMGIESKLTRSSRDGGVDVVGFDKRPVLGGKVVIQAKRYRNTVGVSAVRDLYGTMMNEGANKGILVTTSGYGPDAFDFSKDKPIELIDGGGASLYLLEQVGMQARIVMPIDPA